MYGRPPNNTPSTEAWNAQASGEGVTSAPAVCYVAWYIPQYLESRHEHEESYEDTHRQP